MDAIDLVEGLASTGMFATEEEEKEMSDGKETT